MTSSEIRETFLSFFRSKDHKIVPSAPIVVKNDPTLMFTNAGMNQFKDYFLGNKVAQEKRIADTQKCLRVSGKHNDLDDVGFDTYHHTMFEMLGNWSFGDYFKKEAIEWGWELLTEHFGLPKERLYATVFEGDKKDGLEQDKEAFEIWKSILPEEQILYFPRKDNFWEMGESGPCGPSSEIHFDMRPQHEIDINPGKVLVNVGHPQVIEIWNLVFIQYNRKADGKLEMLPHKHVDTGMGLERLVRAIQKKNSNYDTDLFTPLINHVEQLAGVKYGEKEQTDIAIRVVVDHIRAIVFTIADGQLPGNAKAGYVIRRILRRAVRYGYTFLNLKEPFLYTLLPVISDQFGVVFHEVTAQSGTIAKVIYEEEKSFLRTLEVGLKRLEQITSSTAGKIIGAKDAFELYDTFGFPLDLTMLIAKESNFEVDEEGFHTEMQIQKNRSKQAAEIKKGDWTIIRDGDDTEFVGYSQLQASVKILRYRALHEKEHTRYQVVFDRTPFYAESGGQVGDTGHIESANERIKIIDTQKENDLIIHITEQLPVNLQSEFFAQVDEEKRQLTQNNHSATHLLHAALRQILGQHVQQKGSYVGPDLLRFDFSHFTKMTPEEIIQVERMVNDNIRKNISVSIECDVPIEEAKRKGAMALFGEKYGDKVRVVTFDPDFSVELCGGTHVQATGCIGYFKIISESSIAAGIRRIEAITAQQAETYVDEKLTTLGKVEGLLNNPKDPSQAIKVLLEQHQRLQKELEGVKQSESLEIKNRLKEGAEQHGGINLIVEAIDIPAKDSLKNISFQLKNELEDLIALLAGSFEGKPQLAVMISDSLVKDGWNAGEIVKTLAKEIRGGGGGQPFFATAGGKDVQGIGKVIDLGRKLILDKLGTKV